MKTYINTCCENMMKTMKFLMIKSMKRIEATLYPLMRLLRSVCERERKGKKKLKKERERGEREKERRERKREREIKGGSKRKKE